MPFQLVEPPSGAWMVIGASEERALLGCGGSVLRKVAESGTQPLLLGRGNGERASAFGAEIGTGDMAASIEKGLKSGIKVVWLPFYGSSCQEDGEVLDSWRMANARVPEWDGEIWMYETTTPLWANRGIDVSKQASEKARLLRDRVGRDELEAVMGLHRYRGLRPAIDYAEGFLSLSVKDFRREFDRWNKG